MQLLDLAARFFVLPFQSLQALYLLLDFFQFLLRFESRIHLDDIPITADVMRFHHRQQKLGPDDGRIPGAVLGMLRSGYFRSTHGPNLLTGRDQLITRTLPRPHSSSTRPMKFRSGITL